MSERVYVIVNSDFDAIGYMHPRSIIWEDRRVFPIDKVKDHRPASALRKDLQGEVRCRNQGGNAVPVL